MKALHIGKICSGQDGAIFGDLLFRIDKWGYCKVYDLSSLTDESVPVGEFALDRREQICPHSNAVFFGTEYYAEGDELPVLYSNIYNNHKSDEDKLEGVLCAYRIFRTAEGFGSELVQLIRVGFTGDRELWRSPSGDDVRPYGNLILDAERGRLWAFVMRDGAESTRYFSFDMPRVRDGAISQRFGVPMAVLAAEDIIDSFDTPYHNYIQGAACRGGFIYSLEGFGAKIHPAIRVIDTERGEQIFFLDFFDIGLEVETEFIDFCGDRCIYSDAHGEVFELTDIPKR